MTRRLGERLVLEGALTPEQLSRALAHQQETGQKLGECLVRLGVDETPVLRLLAQEFQTRFVSTQKLAQAKVESSLLEKVPVRLAEGFDFMPLRLTPAALYVAIAEPQRQRALEEISRTVGVAQVLPFVAVRRSIRAAIRKHYYAVADAFDHPPEDDACPHCGAPTQPNDFQCPRCELLLVRHEEDLPPRDNVSLVRALLTQPDRHGTSGVKPRPHQAEDTRVAPFRASTGGANARPFLVGGLSVTNLKLSPFEAYVLSLVDGHTSLADLALITQLTEVELRALFASLEERGVTRLYEVPAPTVGPAPVKDERVETGPPVSRATPEPTSPAPPASVVPPVRPVTSPPVEDPNEDLLQRVIRLEQAGRWTEAVELLERGIGLLPSPAPLYNRLGMILLNHQRDYTRATALFQKASDLEPENSLYTMNLYSVMCLTADATNAGQKKARR
ncbi:general secretion pathway protein GspE [Myxococcus sp. K15C18031901]|uniref:GspE/PulE/PilB domain-containing protein n=1 Tax=Myxococcus dinghuensis TaxID=2906761 RepID=UPI0020A77C0E|nr:general secretion pathway protein GspE [Myxococcus dinghuensis]MCP3102815.1 general secretion pathway protein GspE [Myxococcus dinghuensis]